MSPLLDRVVCVSPLSKDLEGELGLVHSERERCRTLRCETLETQHHLKLGVSAHDCDSEVAKLLDGTLASGDLAHKFADADGNRRGIHEGTFRWSGAGTTATGTLRGVTNAGTHRAPAFDPACQKCEDPGVMEGLLVGTIRKARDRRLIGCTIQAAYRLRFDPSSEGGSGGVRGTLEGAIVCDCPDRPPRTCIELGTLTPASGPNPRVEQGVSFEVFDFSGSPHATTEIRSMGPGPSTGLDVGHRTEIKLPQPCSSVEATLVTFAQPAKVEAFNSDGSLAGSDAMSGIQGNAETLTIAGTSIDRVTIHAEADETLLLRLCFEPLRR
jgi:hypothetical protein